MSLVRARGRGRGPRPIALVASSMAPKASGWDAIWGCVRRPTEWWRRRPPNGCSGACSDCTERLLVDRAGEFLGPLAEQFGVALIPRMIAPLGSGPAVIDVAEELEERLAGGAEQPERAVGRIGVEDRVFRVVWHGDDAALVDAAAGRAKPVHSALVIVVTTLQSAPSRTSRVQEAIVRLIRRNSSGDWRRRRRRPLRGTRRRRLRRRARSAPCASSVARPSA